MGFSKDVLLQLKSEEKAFPAYTFPSLDKLITTLAIF
jgi:hypothetical protein